MINLLPQEQKKKLQEERTFRLVFILGSLAMLFLLSFSMILLSAKIYISGQVQKQKILADLEEKRFESSKAQDLEQEIKEANSKLSKLASFYDEQPDVTEKMEKIARTVPQGISLNSLSLMAEPTENLFEVSLNGRCSTRDILYEFKQRLEAEPDVSQAYFPPSSWAKPENIDFRTTFNLNYDGF